MDLPRCEFHRDGLPAGAGVRLGFGSGALLHLSDLKFPPCPRPHILLKPFPLWISMGQGSDLAVGRKPVTPENLGRVLGELQLFVPLQPLPPRTPVGHRRCRRRFLSLSCSALFCLSLNQCEISTLGRSGRAGTEETAPPSVLASSESRECHPHFPVPAPAPGQTPHRRMSWIHLGSLGSRDVLPSLLRQEVLFRIFYLFYY